jgi:L-aminopeptidase/D-esterase-like protein
VFYIPRERERVRVGEREREEEVEGGSTDLVTLCASFLGPAPGSHEALLASPAFPSSDFSAIVFTGGSALASGAVTAGVSLALLRKGGGGGGGVGGGGGGVGEGQFTPAGVVPLVGASVIFDLWWAKEARENLAREVEAERRRKSEGREDKGKKRGREGEEEELTVSEIVEHGERLRAWIPSEREGVSAALAAFTSASLGAASPVPTGAVGAGTGAICGKWAGIDRAWRGGYGQASMVNEESGVRVFAAAVVNAIGDVVDEAGRVLAGARQAPSPPAGSPLTPSARTSFAVTQYPHRIPPPSIPPPPSNTNTTLVFIATNAHLSKADCHLVSLRGQDALSLSVRPVHTRHDGDAVYCLSQGGVRVKSVDEVGQLAVAVVAAAVRDAVGAKEDSTLFGRVLPGGPL